MNLVFRTAWKKRVLSHHFFHLLFRILHQQSPSKPRESEIECDNRFWPMLMKLFAFMYVRLLLEDECINLHQGFDAYALKQGRSFGTAKIPNKYSGFEFR